MPTQASWRAQRQSRNQSETIPRLRPMAALTLIALAQIAAAGFAHAAEETTLPSITVRAQGERADGLVNGYRAERSATFTRTDTPLKEVPASVQVVPAELSQHGYVEHVSEGKAHRYVPTVEPDIAGRSALARILDTMFGGSHEQLLAQLVSDRRIDPGKLRKLRAVLDARIALNEDEKQP